MTTEIQLNADGEFGEIDQNIGNSSIDTTPTPSRVTADVAGKRVTRVYVGSSHIDPEIAALYDTQQRGVERVTSRDLYDNRQDGSLLATAKTPFGSPTTRYDESTRISYGDMEIDLRTAETLGLVRKTAAGEYVETQPEEQAQQQQVQQPTEEQAQPEQEYFPDDLEQATAALIADIPPQVQDAILAQFIVKGAEGVDWNNAASVSGIAREELQARVHYFTMPFQTQANLAIKSLGADPEEVYEWARNNAKEELQKAMRTQMYARSTKGYKALADRYLRAVAPNVDALQAAGYQVRTHKGEHIVLIDGVWTNLAAAAKLGKI